MAVKGAPSLLVAIDLSDVKWPRKRLFIEQIVHANNTESTTFAYLLAAWEVNLPVDFPHEGSVMQKALPYHDVIRTALQANWGSLVIDVSQSQKAINAENASIARRLNVHYALPYVVERPLLVLSSWCSIMTSSNGSIFCVTAPLCGEFTSHWWIPLTKASHAELWWFLWYKLEQTVE